MSQSGEADSRPCVLQVALPNTTGNSNRDTPETPPLSQRLVAAQLRVLLPPHADNEKAADFLLSQIGQNDNAIKWFAVRVLFALEFFELGLAHQ